MYTADIIPTGGMPQGRIRRRYRHAEPRGDRPSSSKNARPRTGPRPNTRAPERAAAARRARSDYRNATSPTGLRNFRECNSAGFADIASHARTAVIKCSTFDA